MSNKQKESAAYSVDLQENLQLLAAFGFKFQGDFPRGSCYQGAGGRIQLFWDTDETPATFSGAVRAAGEWWELHPLQDTLAGTIAALYELKGKLDMRQKMFSTSPFEG